MKNKATHILTLSCADRPAIVAAVATVIAAVGGNIVEAAQFGEPDEDRFFMRVAFSVTAEGAARFQVDFAGTAIRFGMDWILREAGHRPRVLIMVSKFDHCLNDLLYRHSIGALPAELPLIVSNHRDAERLSASYGIPFVHLPVSPDTKPRQEAELLELVVAERIELIVLARYMQVLSAELCRRMSGQIINIHHSFLPSFKGAKPYHQAYARGVKLIGATAHYVTSDLDEGPIIEQDAMRVSHDLRADDLVVAGRDVESSVLSRAVKYHLENRVLMNAQKTVVFR